MERGLIENTTGSVPGLLGERLTVRAMKNQAMALKEELWVRDMRVKYADCLGLIASRHGYPDWAHALIDAPR